MFTDRQKALIISSIYQVKQGYLAKGVKEELNEILDILDNKVTYFVNYQMKDDIESKEKEFSTLEEARNFYDGLYEEMILHREIINSEGTIYE